MSQSRCHTARKWLIFWTLFLGRRDPRQNLRRHPDALDLYPVYMFPLNVMSAAYFIFGLCQAVAGFAAWKLLKKEETDPKNA